MSSRTQDVFLKEWVAGKDLAVDLALVNPAAVSAPRPAAGSAAAFFAQAARAKCSASEGKCAGVGVAFTPMIFDTWGGVHGAGKALWTAIAAKCAGRGAPNQSARLGLLRQGLAMAALRGVVPQLQVLQAVAADPLPWWSDAPLPPQVVDEAGNVVNAL